MAESRGAGWLGLVGRGALAIVVLFVLAWIGRTATLRSARAETILYDNDAGTHAGAPEIASSPVPVVPLQALPMAASASSSTPTAPHGRATSDDPVYVNYAGPDELRRLPGVGAKRAAAILELRARIGRFQRIEDLLRVKGIGRGAVRRWRPLVRLDSPARADAGGS